MLQEKVKCACGCGQEFDKYDKKRRIRRYISGHNSKIDNPHKGEKVSLKCDWCNKEIYKLKCQIELYQYHFCSRHCKAKWIGNKLSNDYLYKERQRQLIKKKGNKPPIHIGMDHWNWKGGISKPNRGEDYKYLQWRKDVFVKYNYICQICGIRGGKLSSHHIISWVDNVDLRYDLDNGLCLCYDCHMKLHGLKKKITYLPQQLELF